MMGIAQKVSRVFTDAVRSRFESAKTAKPESSRQISIEQYVIGKGFRP